MSFPFFFFFSSFSSLEYLAKSFVLIDDFPLVNKALLLYFLDLRIAILPALVRQTAIPLIFLLVRESH